MERLQLVRNLSDVDITDSQNPVIKPDSVVGELRVSAELAAVIFERVRQGEPITLEFLGQERPNGFYLLAGTLAGSPVEVSKDPPAPQEDLGVTITNNAGTEPAAEVRLAPPQGDKAPDPVK